MKGVVKYFINNEIAGNILMILLFVVGIIGLLQMKTTFFPEVESRLIAIQAIYPGSSPEEVEEGIVSKIEENLKGLTGVERVTSVSSENSANINVEVLKGFDTDVILQDVKNAVDRISSFPVDMEPLVIFKQENLGFAINFAISGDVPLKTLKTIARQAEDDIRALEDVSKVELSGFPDEEIEITFREEDLRANNITFSEAANRIRLTNLEVTGGTIKTETEELLIRANNKQYNAADLQDIVIKTNPDGGVVRLYEIADIKDRFTDRPQRTYVDGNPAVVVVVQNTLEEDMLDVTDKVKTYLQEFEKKFPEVDATILRDGSITLRQRIDLLTSNGITGFIIVLILLAMFLHYRLAFWVALAIPISFAGMFIFASLIGVTINVISLFGMIIVIGILVDDGIVIAENIYQHYEDGEPAFKAALNGTMEVLPAVFSAIITTVIAFSAFFFIDGRLGDFFREMAIVVIFSLVFSLVEGALILPAHIAHSKALARDRKPNMIQRGLDNMMLFLKDRLYGPILNWAVRYNWPTLAICCAGLFVVAGALSGGLIKSTFFPVIPRENFQVQLKLASGTREDITLDVLNRIEDAVVAVNDELKEEFFGDSINPIENIQKTIGPSSYEGNLNVALLEGETRGDVTANVIIGRIREKVGPLPMAETFTFGSGSPFGKALSLSLLGEDGDQLSAAVDAVKANLEKIPDLKDIVDNNQEGLKEIELELTQKAYNLGFTLSDIISQVRQGFFGAEAQRIQRGEDEVRIWVRYGEEDRSDISDLSDMRIRTPDGQSIPLEELATFNTERGVININRIEGAREVRIEADVANDQVSISDVTSDVRNVILPETLKEFPGVVASFEGQEREQAKTRDSLQLVMPIIFLMMLFVIILTFKSVSQALIVFALLPFGFIGVGAGHYIHGLPISLFSILGVIALIGIFVNDALVFITTYNEKIKNGVPQQQAVIETGRSRFRPILLTSITTIAGLAPLILEKSFQAQFLIPMAISVAYGLLFGTFVLLVLIPALLMIVNRIKRTAIHAYEGEKPSREMVEPAYPGRQSNFLVFLFAGLVALLIFGMLVFGLFKASSVFALI
ncbi:efflux RND transporter permease subunit [Portibacter marinus]|uniref:efflux RND transporter permease subunit n=1 Tax=Portibacter marinus TaxID=2898660 RepID=UPI001F311207|nr:efflux RND transporter permease subunit [Portibacter marinus]